MHDTEILSYCPKTNVDDFIDYVVNGVKKPNGEFAIDEHDRLITGVMAWLHGREIPEVHFFASASENPIQLFVATLRPPDNENETVPWLADLPGLEQMVNMEGLIGSAPDFPSTIPPNMTTPLGWVVPRPDLDQIFTKEQERIAKIDFEKFEFTKDEFLAALRGVKETNLRELLSTINSESNLKVMENLLAPAR